MCRGGGIQNHAQTEVLPANSMVARGTCMSSRITGVEGEEVGAECCAGGAQKIQPILFTHASRAVHATATKRSSTLQDAPTSS
jgi:hypothetical protein